MFYTPNAASSTDVHVLCLQGTVQRDLEAALATLAVNQATGPEIAQMFADSAWCNACSVSLHIAQRQLTVGDRTLPSSLKDYLLDYTYYAGRLDNVSFSKPVCQGFCSS